MQRLYFTLKRHFCFRSAYIIGKTNVKRFVEIADEMNQVIERKLFFGKW